MKLFDSFPARYVAPNAVTCVGLVFGLASIRTSLTATGPEGFATAAWFILYAVLLDKLDGAVLVISTKRLSEILPSLTAS